jgi:flagellar motor protein MotB
MKAAVERLGGLELIEKKVAELGTLQKELAEKKSDDLPPLIRLSEADGFHFQLGRSELSKDFDTFLRTKVIPLLLDMTKKYSVDVIEVVGHTDPVPMSGLQPSNLDAELRNTLLGSSLVANLTPADNAGLGMSRAVAVSRVLLENQELKQLRIVPLSAAQLIDLNEQLDTTTKIATEGQKERRRIEIRLRRATGTQALKKDP